MQARTNSLMDVEAVGKTFTGPNSAAATELSVDVARYLHEQPSASERSPQYDVGGLAMLNDEDAHNALDSIVLQVTGEDGVQSGAASMTRVPDGALPDFSASLRQLQMRPLWQPASETGAEAEVRGVRAGQWRATEVPALMRLPSRPAEVSAAAPFMEEKEQELERNGTRYTTGDSHRATTCALDDARGVATRAPLAADDVAVALCGSGTVVAGQSVPASRTAWTASTTASGGGEVAASEDCMAHALPTITLYDGLHSIHSDTFPASYSTPGRPHGYGASLSHGTPNAHLIEFGTHLNGSSTHPRPGSHEMAGLMAPSASITHPMGFSMTSSVYENSYSLPVPSLTPAAPSPTSALVPVVGTRSGAMMTELGAASRTGQPETVRTLNGSYGHIIHGGPSSTTTARVTTSAPPMGTSGTQHEGVTRVETAHQTSPVAPSTGESVVVNTTTVPQESSQGGTWNVSDDVFRSNLFVCGLSPEVRDGQLVELFGKYGEIESAKVMLDIHTGRSRCIAFVKFRLASSAAQATRELNGYVLCGQAITIREANSRAAYLPGSPTNKTFVRNVPPSVTKEALLAYFTQFGDVIDITIHSDTAAHRSTTSSNPITPAGASMLNGNLSLTGASFSLSNGYPVATCANPGAVYFSSLAPPQPTNGAPSGLEVRRNIVFVTFTTLKAAALAAERTHTTMPFPECEGVPLLAKVAEDNMRRMERLARRNRSSLTSATSMSSVPGHDVAMVTEMGGAVLTTPALHDRHAIPAPPLLSAPTLYTDPRKPSVTPTFLPPPPPPTAVPFLNPTAPTLTMPITTTTTAPAPLLYGGEGASRAAPVMVFASAAGQTGAVPMYYTTMATAPSVLPPPPTAAVAPMPQPTPSQGSTLIAMPGVQSAPYYVLMNGY